MARRQLKDHFTPEGRLPLTKWRKERDELQQAYQQDYAKYKPIREDLMKLYQAKSAVDIARRQQEQAHTHRPGQGRGTVTDFPFPAASGKIKLVLTGCARWDKVSQSRAGKGKMVCGVRVIWRRNMIISNDSERYLNYYIESIQFQGRLQINAIKELVNNKGQGAEYISSSFDPEDEDFREGYVTLYFWKPAVEKDVMAFIDKREFFKAISKISKEFIEKEPRVKEELEGYLKQLQNTLNISD